MKIDDLKERKIEREFIFTASRSSGPGGQNINKVNTRIELRFKINESACLKEREKKILLQKLKNRINSDGELIITCQTERSQLKNKDKAIEKFYSLLAKSLTLKSVRISTKPTRVSKRERLDSKRKRALIKKARGKITGSSEDK